MRFNIARSALIFSSAFSFCQLAGKYKYYLDNKAIRGVTYLAMKPKIIDAETGRELWTAIECAEFSGTARGTFTSYAGRGRAPKPVAKHHGLTLWDSEIIKEWVDERAAGNKGLTSIGADSADSSQSVES